MARNRNRRGNSRQGLGDSEALLYVGGGLLGLLGLWWLTRNEGSGGSGGGQTVVDIGPAQIEQTQAQTEAYFGPGGQGPIPPGGAPPPPAGQAMPAAQGPRSVRITSNPMTLRSGRVYRARIELSPLEALAASRDRIAQEFQNLGFRNVRVAMNTSELDGSWPSDAASGATSNSRWATGIWAGQGASQTVQRPANISLVWEDAFLGA